MQSFMKILQVFLINHLVFNMDVVQHGQFSLNCGWKQVVKHWCRQQFSWKQIASVGCTCFVVLNQLCKDEHERFCDKDFMICYTKNDYFIQLQFGFKFHHSCSLGITRNNEGILVSFDRCFMSYMAYFGGKVFELINCSTLLTELKHCLMYGWRCIKLFLFHKLNAMCSRVIPL